MHDRLYSGVIVTLLRDHFTFDNYGQNVRVLLFKLVRPSSP